MDGVEHTIVGQNKNTMREIRKVVIIANIIAITLFIIYMEYSYYLGETQYINREFFGVIQEIRYIENRRGIPEIKIANEWVVLTTFESKVALYIHVNDSIVKTRGSKAITVFRKKPDGNWRQRVFK